MLKYITEYRINKKGCECYRSPSLEETKERLQYLQARHPHTKFEMQTRYARLDKYGLTERNWKGEINWSIWD